MSGYKEYKLYINGEWVKSGSGKTFKSINPATEKVIGEFQSGNKDDVKKAIDAAKEAFDKWSEFPAPKRGELLLKIAQKLRERKEELSRLVVDEMGKVIEEARGDVQEAIDMTEYMAGEGRRLFGHTTPSELKNKFCMTKRMPIGVFALISPWNFPFAIPAWKIMPALICGNGVIFKPSSDTPLCAVKLIEIIEESGIPKGVVNLITGSGKDVGSELVKSKRIDGISFTGSKATGEFVVREGGLKKIGLELGGKNPIIVMDDADLNLAVDGIIWGAFGTTGQRCTACSRVIVHKGIKEKLLKKLLETTKKLKVGYGGDKKTDVGPLINKRALEKVESYTQIGIKEGAKLICGGKQCKQKGFFYEPTIFSDVTKDMRIAKEEIFGPSLSIIEFEKLSEAIGIVNAVDYGLVSSIYTNDISNAFKVIEKAKTGLTYINSSTIGSEVHLPFGGMKGTGNGTREGGIEGINEFSETKTVYIDYSGKLQKAQIDVVKN